MTNGIHTDTRTYSHDWTNANGALSTLDIRIENAAVGYTTESGDDTIIGGAAATANQTGFAGGAGNDRILSGAETSLADAIAQGGTQGSSGRGVYKLAGDEGKDQIIRATDNGVLFGGDGDETLVGGGGSNIVFADGSDDGIWRTTTADGSEPTRVVGSKDPLSGESARFALRLLVARRGITASDTTGARRELWKPLASDINPLCNIDRFGLLAMRRADIHPREGDATNLIPDSQLTYAEFTDGKYFGTNAGRGDDVIHAGAGNDIVLAGTGKDMVASYDGEDVIEGGTGDDRVYGDYVASTPSGVQATETYTVFGASYVARNTMDGSKHGSDQLDGGDGDDVIVREASTTRIIRVRSAAASDQSVRSRAA